MKTFIVTEAHENTFESVWSTEELAQKRVDMLHELGNKHESYGFEEAEIDGLKDGRVMYGVQVDAAGKKLWDHGKIVSNGECRIPNHEPNECSVILGVGDTPEEALKDAKANMEKWKSQHE